MGGSGQPGQRLRRLQARLHHDDRASGAEARGKRNAVKHQPFRCPVNPESKQAEQSGKGACRRHQLETERAWQ
ncbi:hypothetical protein D3C80_2186960 [compost metagenome]